MNMKTIQKLSLFTLALCAVGVAGLAITTEAPQAEAGSAAGFTKHCPVYFYGEYDGDLLWMTQNCEHCGSDYVWTHSWHNIDYGCEECGYYPDCSDPIYVDEKTGQSLTLVNPVDNDVQVAAIKPIPESECVPTQVRQTVALIQKDYVAPRFGEPGESRHKLGRFVSESEKVSFTGDADFVVKVKFGETDVRYFRVLELKIDQQKTAESHVLRYGKELDPNIDSNCVAKYEAKVVESNQHIHQLKIIDDVQQRQFLATTVTPAFAH
ncbi:MAG: hypothetical protein HUJ26_11680 [Planctomycetaceae bacterium]|nr:hypothetical protein [Planctomycetaceae bacterium]